MKLTREEHIEAIRKRISTSVINQLGTEHTQLGGRATTYKDIVDPAKVAAFIFDEFMQPKQEHHIEQREHCVVCTNCGIASGDGEGIFFMDDRTTPRPCVPK